MPLPWKLRNGRQDHVAPYLKEMNAQLLRLFPDEVRFGVPLPHAHFWL